jgi:hypothetical protein
MRMFRMHWRCLSCRDQTLSLEVPFDQHGELPPAELYCLACQRMTTHEAHIPPRPRYTVGDALAMARAEDEAEASAYSAS